MDSLNYDLNYVLLNPSLSESLKAEAQRLAAQHPSTKKGIWLMSSGTSSTHAESFKLMALSHTAMLTSAEAVNQHLKVTPQDRWLNVLPLFHVGGLSILYRAQLAQIPCDQEWSADFKWDPILFLKLIQERKSTLVSLVPTQVFDLVRLKMRAPLSLRIVLVGGGALPINIYLEARALGWPLLTSFGMTEVGSQIATAPLSSLKDSAATEFPPLARLPHVRLKTDEEERLYVGGMSLFEGYYPLVQGKGQDWVCPIEKGWYPTQDRAELNLFYLTLLSRIDEVIKIRGENVNLAHLRQRLEQLRSSLTPSLEGALIARPHERLGHELFLVGTGRPEDFKILFDRFNEGQLGYERLAGWKDHISIPRTSLGKVQYAQLTKRMD